MSDLNTLLKQAQTQNQALSQSLGIDSTTLNQQRESIIAANNAAAEEAAKLPVSDNLIFDAIRRNPNYRAGSLVDSSDLAVTADPYAGLLQDNILSREVKIKSFDNPSELKTTTLANALYGADNWRNTVLVDTADGGEKEISVFDFKRADYEKAREILRGTDLEEKLVKSPIESGVYSNKQTADQGNVKEIPQYSPIIGSEDDWKNYLQTIRAKETQEVQSGKLKAEQQTWNKLSLQVGSFLQKQEGAEQKPLNLDEILAYGKDKLVYADLPLTAKIQGQEAIFNPHSYLKMAEEHFNADDRKTKFSDLIRRDGNRTYYQQPEGFKQNLSNASNDVDRIWEGDGVAGKILGGGTIFQAIDAAANVVTGKNEGRSIQEEYDRIRTSRIKDFEDGNSATLNTVNYITNVPKRLALGTYNAVYGAGYALSGAAMIAMGDTGSGVANIAKGINTAAGVKEAISGSTDAAAENVSEAILPVKIPVNLFGKKQEIGGKELANFGGDIANFVTPIQIGNTARVATAARLGNGAVGTGAALLVEGGVTSLIQDFQNPDLNRSFSDRLGNVAYGTALNTITFGAANALNAGFRKSTGTIFAKLANNPNSKQLTTTNPLFRDAFSDSELGKAIKNNLGSLENAQSYGALERLDRGTAAVGDIGYKVGSGLVSTAGFVASAQIADFLLGSAVDSLMTGKPTARNTIDQLGSQTAMGLAFAFAPALMRNNKEYRQVLVDDLARKGTTSVEADWTSASEFIRSNLPDAIYNPKPEHFQALGVAEGASPEVVKAAYIEKARTTHPDKNNGDASQFIKIKQAADALLGEQVSLLDDLRPLIKVNGKDFDINLTGKDRGLEGINQALREAGYNPEQITGQVKITSTIPSQDLQGLSSYEIRRRISDVNSNGRVFLLDFNLKSEDGSSRPVSTIIGVSPQANSEYKVTSENEVMSKSVVEKGAEVQGQMRAIERVEQGGIFNNAAFRKARNEDFVAVRQADQSVVVAWKNGKTLRNIYNEPVTGKVLPKEIVTKNQFVNSSLGEFISGYVDTLKGLNSVEFVKSIENNPAGFINQFLQSKKMEQKANSETKIEVQESEKAEKSLQEAYKQSNNGSLIGYNVYDLGKSLTQIAKAKKLKLENLSDEQLLALLVQNDPQKVITENGLIPGDPNFGSPALTNLASLRQAIEFYQQKQAIIENEAKPKAEIVAETNKFEQMVEGLTLKQKLIEMGQSRQKWVKEWGGVYKEAVANPENPDSIINLVTELYPDVKELRQIQEALQKQEFDVDYSLKRSIYLASKFRPKNRDADKLIRNKDGKFMFVKGQTANDYLLDFLEESSPLYRNIENLDTDSQEIINEIVSEGDSNPFLYPTQKQSQLQEQILFDLMYENNYSNIKNTYDRYSQQITARGGKLTRQPAASGISFRQPEVAQGASSPQETTSSPESPPAKPEGAETTASQTGEQSPANEETPSANEQPREITPETTPEPAQTQPARAAALPVAAVGLAGELAKTNTNPMVTVAETYSRGLQFVSDNLAILNNFLLNDNILISASSSGLINTIPNLVIFGLVSKAWQKFTPRTGLLRLGGVTQAALDQKSYLNDFNNSLQKVRNEMSSKVPDLDNLVAVADIIAAETPQAEAIYNAINTIEDATSGRNRFNETFEKAVKPIQEPINQVDKLIQEEQKTLNLKDNDGKQVPIWQLFSGIGTVVDAKGKKSLGFAGEEINTFGQRNIKADRVSNPAFPVKDLVKNNQAGYSVTLNLESGKQEFLPGKLTEKDLQNLDFDTRPDSVDVADVTLENANPMKNLLTPESYKKAEEFLAKLNKIPDVTNIDLSNMIAQKANQFAKAKDGLKGSAVIRTKGYILSLQPEVDEERLVNTDYRPAEEVETGTRKQVGAGETVLDKIANFNERTTPQYRDSLFRQGGFNRAISDSLKYVTNGYKNYQQALASSRVKIYTNINDIPQSRRKDYTLVNLTNIPDSIARNPSLAVEYSLGRYTEPTLGEGKISGKKREVGVYLPTEMVSSVPSLFFLSKNLFQKAVTELNRFTNYQPLGIVWKNTQRTLLANAFLNPGTLVARSVGESFKSAFRFNQTAYLRVTSIEGTELRRNNLDLAQRVTADLARDVLTPRKTNVYKITKDTQNPLTKTVSRFLDTFVQTSGSGDRVFVEKGNLLKRNALRVANGFFSATRLTAKVANPSFVGVIVSDLVAKVPQIGNYNQFTDPILANYASWAAQNNRSIAPETLRQYMETQDYAIIKALTLEAAGFEGRGTVQNLIGNLATVDASARANAYLTSQLKKSQNFYNAFTNLTGKVVTGKATPAERKQWDINVPIFLLTLVGIATTIAAIYDKSIKEASELLEKVSPGTENYQETAKDIQRMLQQKQNMVDLAGLANFGQSYIFSSIPFLSNLVSNTLGVDPKTLEKTPEQLIMEAKINEKDREVLKNIEKQKKIGIAVSGQDDGLQNLLPVQIKTILITGQLLGVIPPEKAKVIKIDGVEQEVEGSLFDKATKSITEQEFNARVANELERAEKDKTDVVTKSLQGINNKIASQANTELARKAGLKEAQELRERFGDTLFNQAAENLSLESLEDIGKNQIKRDKGKTTYSRKAAPTIQEIKEKNSDEGEKTTATKSFGSSSGSRSSGTRRRSSRLGRNRSGRIRSTKLKTPKIKKLKQPRTFRTRRLRRTRVG